MKSISKVVTSAALLAAIAVYAGPANAALQAAGPVGAVTTIPAFYQDVPGLALAPCLDQNTFCVLTPDFDPLLNATPLPITTTGPINDTNFPNEIFYFLADSKMVVQGPGGGDTAVLRLALEASFLATAPPPAPIVAPNTGITFLRINLKKMSGLTPNSSYTVTHPFGTFPFTTDAGGNTVLGLAGQAFRTQDPFAGGVAGIYFPPELQAATNTGIGPFLVSAGGPVTAPDGNKYIGNPLLATAVTGSPLATNVFRIDGPNIGGSGVNTISTTLFNLSGKLVGLEVASPAGGNDFGAWKLATPATAKTYTVTNLSSSTFAPTLASSNAAEFAITPGTCAAPLAPNAVCTFDVTFTPTTNGARTSTLSLSNAAVPTVNVALTGAGDGIAPTLTLDPVVTFTKLATQTISGSVSDNIAVGSVNVTVNGVSQGTAIVTPGTPTSTWTKAITLPTANGANNISVTAIDTAQIGGNTSAAQTAIITNDTINPVVAITSPAAGLTNNKSPVLTFTATDNINVAFSNAVVDLAPVNPTPATLGPLADGPHTVTINAGDSAGNAGTATTSFTVDATPPVITVTSPKIVNARIGQTNPALTVTVNDANPVPANTHVTLDGVDVTANATLGPFTAGTNHTLVVNATDGAGNLSTTTLPFTIILADGRIVAVLPANPGIADALLALKHAVGLITLVGDQFAHGDVAPLVNGVPSPDGVINIADALAILKRAVGLPPVF